MDSKRQENHLKKFDEKSLEKLQSKLIFSDPIYSFIFKKTEKVIAAIYLVTNLISDNEPVKWQIRKLSIGLVSDILALKKSQTSEVRRMIMTMVSDISEIISLLKIASTTEQISFMNYSILQKELALVMTNLESIDTDRLVAGTSVILSPDFFNTPAPIFTSARPTIMSNTATSAMPGQIPSKGQYKTQNDIKDSQSQKDIKDNIKDNRREKIIQLLKPGKSLGIKDFALEIKDCSEKTIQRELLVMVEKGVLKKTGERRWSLYSLI